MPNGGSGAHVPPRPLLFWKNEYRMEPPGRLFPHDRFCSRRMDAECRLRAAFSPATYFVLANGCRMPPPGRSSHLGEFACNEWMPNDGSGAHVPPRPILFWRTAY